VSWRPPPPENDGGTRYIAALILRSVVPKVS